MSLRVAIFIADQFTDSGLSIAVDVLRTANALVSHRGEPEPFTVQVASPTGGSVRAASGLELRRTLAATRLKPDVVMVPGMWVESPEALVAMLRRPDVRTLVRAIKRAHARGALIASACGGAFLLADAGLLDGHQATTAWWHAEHLKKHRPAIDVVPQASLIAGPRVVTGGAVFAQADVALHLVARLASPVLAQQCANLLLLDTHVSQAPYMAARQLRVSDPLVLQAEAWIRTHLSEAIDIPTLARQLGTSSRTLARRLHAAAGMGPVAFVQKMRVDAAVTMLQTTALTLEEICGQVGYSDTSTLSRLIRRQTKTSPRDYRRRRAALP